MGFTLLFLGEYGKIVFGCFLTSYLFFPNFMIFTHKLVMLLLLIVILIFRGTFPRFRYDFLMGLA